MFREALTERGRILFPRLTHFAQYYLAGGTALALQIGHRVSEDFDCFSDATIPPSLFDEVVAYCAPAMVMPSVNDAGELTVFVDGVKITFLHYPFPILRPFVDLDGVRALGILELAATKAYTIGRRGSYKDYVDIDTVLAGGHADLTAIIALAEEKYGDVFNARLFLEQLVYLDDVPETPLTFLGPTRSRDEVRRRLEAAVHGVALE